jgi:hypothetical protein
MTDVVVKSWSFKVLAYIEYLIKSFNKHSNFSIIFAEQSNLHINIKIATEWLCFLFMLENREECLSLLLRLIKLVPFEMFIQEFASEIWRLFCIIIWLLGNLFRIKSFGKSSVEKNRAKLNY